MSDLTDRITAEHRFTVGIETTCSCSVVVTSPRGVIRHIAEVTEAAVREQIAADIEAVLPPSVVTTGPAAYVAGMRDGLHAAARIARGEDR